MPSGRKVGLTLLGSPNSTWSEIHIVRLDADGKAVEHWSVDQLGMLAQLSFTQASGQLAGVAT